MNLPTPKEFMNSCKNEDRWLMNLLVAHVVMSEMPDKSIFPWLEGWCRDPDECGSPACFGGWVARIPYFQKQGVEVASDGSPSFNGRGSMYTAEHLFGDMNMFAVRGGFRGNVSDREYIVTRIETRIYELVDE